MTTLERESIASICLMAAFVDGVQNDAEHNKLRAVLEEVGMVDDGVFQRAVMRRTTLEEEARKLSDPSLRRLAYDLAVGVCTADGTTSSSERDFLARLASQLQVTPHDASSTVEQGNEFADIRLDEPTPSAGAAATTSAHAISSTAAATSPAVKDIDDTIMKYSALCAGIELLPQTLATVAIIPLQVKMVHAIGARHGYKLDAGHIKEFIATVGIGMTSQVVESYARRFLGRVAKMTMGGIAGALVSKSAGPAMTFASTYALGQVAKAYYAGGRKLSMNDLRSLFSSKVEEAKGVYQRNEGSIMSTARTIDPRRLATMLQTA